MNKSTLIGAFVVLAVSMFAVSSLSIAEEPAQKTPAAKADTKNVEAKPAVKDTNVQKAVPQAAVAGPPEEQRQKAMKPFEEQFKKLDSIYRKRHKSGYAKKGLEMARKLVKDNPESFDAQWRLSRSAFWFAERAVARGDEKTAKDIGWEGYQAGLKAIEKNPKGVQGYYYGVASLGQYSKGIGIFKALSMDISGKYEDMCGKAIKLNKRYNMGGPLRTYGRYYYKLPWPKRDLEKSTKLLEEVTRLFPKKLRNHAYLADTYAKDDRDDLALKHYKICADGDPGKEEYSDGILWKDYCMTKVEELSK